MTIVGKIEYNTSTTYTQPPAGGWVDASVYLRWVDGVTITRGRADEASAVTPSKMSFVLDNATGRFTPGNTGSPIFPAVTVPLWVRFTVVDASLSINSLRFTGLADSFVPDVTGDNADRVVYVTASDVLQRLSRFRNLRSALHEEILADAPIAFYPMDDGSGAESFSDQSGNAQPPLQVLSIGATGTMDPAGTDAPPGTGAKAPNFTPDLSQVVSTFNSNGLGKYLLTNLTNGLTVGNGHAYTIEWWMKINRDGANSDYNGFRYRFPGMMLFETPQGTSGSLYGGYYDTPFGLLPPDPQPAPYYTYGDGQTTLLLGTNAFGGDMPIGYSGALNTDTWYHFACVSDGGSTASSAKFYMNGHFMGATGTTAPNRAYDPPPATVRDLTYLVLAGLPLYGGALLDGSVAYAALYETALTQPRLLEHYLAGRNGYHGETLRNRLVRLVKYAGLGDQSASAAVETSETPVVKQDGDKALTLINQLEVTEQGMFFIDAAGLPVFYNRSHRYTSAVLTLATPDLDGADLQMVLDDQRLLNDVTTTTGAGSTYRSLDAASIAANGAYQRDVTTVAASPTNADETSRWIIAGRATPQVRLPSIKINLLTQPAYRVAALAAKLLDRVTLSTPPTGYTLTPTAIEGWTEKWALREQAMTFTVTPNAPAPATVYTIGVGGSDEVDTSAARLGY